MHARLPTVTIQANAGQQILFMLPFSYTPLSLCMRLHGHFATIFHRDKYKN